MPANMRSPLMATMTELAGLDLLAPVPVELLATVHLDLLESECDGVRRQFN